MLEGIKREWLDLYWPVVEPWIEKAAQQTGCPWTLAQIRTALEERRMQMWVVWADGTPNIVLITETYETAAGLTCSITVAAGSKLNESWPALDTVQRWAKEQGCVRMTLEGRKGWERLMSPRGWRVASIQMETTL
jgi:hypothetical protein